MFQGRFESNYPSQLIDYAKNCDHHDIPDDDRVMFFRYLSANILDARQYYDTLITIVRKTETALKWKIISASFATSHASLKKQTEGLNKLHVIRLEDVRDKENNYYTALHKLTRGVDQLASMTCINNRDDDAEERFLTCAIIKQNEYYTHCSEFSTNHRIKVSSIQCIHQ